MKVSIFTRNFHNQNEVKNHLQKATLKQIQEVNDLLDRGFIEDCYETMLYKEKSCIWCRLLEYRERFKTAD